MIDSSGEQAKGQAFTVCSRIFAGTPGNVPGAILTKDIVYRKGNIETWKLMKKDGVDQIDLNFGKFDPSNPEDIAILVDLGFSDDLLKLLDE